MWVLWVNLASSDERNPRADIALTVVNSHPIGSMISRGLCRPGGGGHAQPGHCLPSFKDDNGALKSSQQLQQRDLDESDHPKAPRCWVLVAEMASSMALCSLLVGVDIV